MIRPITQFTGTVTSITSGGATLHIKQDYCGVEARYDKRTVEVCAVYKHDTSEFIQFVTFISHGHMRDFENDEVNAHLIRVWTSEWI